MLSSPNTATNSHHVIPLSGAHHLRIVNVTCRQEWEWEELYYVDFEAVEMPNSNAFDISVVFHWELLDDQNSSAPDFHRLIALARQIVRDEFAGGKCPRLRGQRHGIEIHHPPSPDLAI